MVSWLIYSEVDKNKDSKSSKLALRGLYSEKLDQFPKS